MRKLFDRQPDYRAATFAEAQALSDDGLDREFVLGLFPDDADWLSDMLQATEEIGDAYASEGPSYFFEASLKSKFLAAARTQPAPTPQFNFGGLRTAAASLSVVSAAAGIGVLALGFVTAGNAVPGDWNYSFKLANERLEYTLSRGDDRIDVQIRQTQNRVEEIRIKSARGDASPEDIAKFERDARALIDLAQTHDLDDYQIATVKGVANQGAVVLNDVSKKQPELSPSVNAASDTLGQLQVLAPATSTASATSIAAPPTSVNPTPGTPEPSGTAEPSPSASPAATGTPTPEASATSTATPIEEETATPTGTSTPGATETASPSATP
jgi:hypothetical protein